MTEVVRLESSPPTWLRCLSHAVVTRTAADGRRSYHGAMSCATSREQACREALDPRNFGEVTETGRTREDSTGPRMA